MADMVRWDVLGTGKIARIVARALADCEGGELVAVGSRDAERAKEFSAEFCVARSGAYGAVVEDEGVDLVYVATHHPWHREWAVRAAESGKHVLCEKPMAVTEADASQIVAAARRNGSFLAEAFAYRCHPQTSRLLDLLRDSAVGGVRLIDAVFGYDAGPSPANYLPVRLRLGPPRRVTGLVGPVRLLHPRDRSDGCGGWDGHAFTDVEVELGYGQRHAGRARQT